MDLARLLADVAAEVRQDEQRAAREDAERHSRAARRFLQTLDPESQEGMWFEAFAESFPNRFAAAVAYVKDSTTVG